MAAVPTCPRVFIAALLILCGFLAVTPQARAGTYTVSGIPVDVTAADASTARDQAIVDGQRAALQKLVENMMGVEKDKEIPIPSDDEISAMVQDFEVETERVSSVRYVGSLTYRFLSDPVDRLVGRAPAGTLDTTAMPMPAGPVRTITAKVPISGLQQWMDVRSKLVGVPLLHRADVRYLAPDEGKIDLVFSGEPAQLMQALAQRQLQLTQNGPDWMLVQLGVPGATTP
ncbi:MAG TPA: hypothetical protein VFZ07_03355 [Dongiaceae bacterium]